MLFFIKIIKSDLGLKTISDFIKYNDLYRSQSNNFLDYWFLGDKYRYPFSIIRESKTVTLYSDKNNIILTELEFNEIQGDKND